MKRNRYVLVLFLMGVVSMVLTPRVMADPVARSGISVSSGWTGLPSLARNAFKTTDSTYNMEGYTIGVSYISYGSDGPKGVFSSRYSLAYSHYRTLPNTQDFTAAHADMFMFDVAEIVTAFPSWPVNLYTGIGMGWGIVHLYHWGLPTDPNVDPQKAKDLENQIGKYYLPFPTIYIPIGLNIRIDDFIISAEAGIRDIPYVVGMVTYTFNKRENVRVVKRFIPLSSPEHTYTGKIQGRVIDQGTSAPLGRAVVQMVNTGMTDLSTDPINGSFTTPGLKPGSVTLSAYKEGYTANTVTVTVQPGTTVSTVIGLEKESTIGAAYGRVTNLQGNPLTATISVAVHSHTGGMPQISQQVTGDAATGGFFIKLPAGNYILSASMAGYKAQTKDIHIDKGFKTAVDFVLETEQPAPPPVAMKKQRVFIEKDKKRIVITEKIFFQLGKSRIMPVSFGILNELAGLLIQNPGITIRIEGYTDNIGKPSTNLKLSQARAEAVMSYLARKGVDARRMTAKGYGMASPIANNRTAKGRAENRRVEFTITSQ
ncbi:MAG: carboxypeptidase regulatory-like domain-containing protein [Deltaproteobacteria bacterium]|nr:carboxypeptidase regulatory-like domain-containing protein [Deltaproteobacteria bacterium]